MAIDSDTLSHLFVYGTLRPGDVRWHLLQPFVVDEGWADTATGSVYDTGRDYPAAIFDAAGAAESATSGTIHGRTYSLLESSIDRCLEVLDHEEGTVGGAYKRVAVTTGCDVRAWAYAYGTGLELTLIESGDWFARLQATPTDMMHPSASVDTPSGRGPVPG